MSTLQFNIPIPAPGGFVGRQCVSRECRRYFLAQAKDVPAKLFCPYCGGAGPVSAMMTPQQRAYAMEVGKEKALKYAHDEVARMMQRSFGNMPSSGPVKFTYTPGPAYRERHILPRYREKTVDTEFCCPGCNYQFKVFGIFGFCPRCRTENAQIYDANLAMVRSELMAAKDQQRALRHAYGDLVSTVEMFCKNKAPDRTVGQRRSYQRLADVEALAVERIGKKLNEILTPEHLLALRTVFQKRHAAVHNAGIIDERFTQQLPGSEHLLGKKIEMSVDEFDTASAAVHRIITAMFVPTAHPRGN